MTGYEHTVKLRIKIAVFILGFLCALPLSLSAENTDSLAVKVRFKVDSPVVLPDFQKNYYAISDFVEAYRKLVGNDKFYDVRIYIRGNSSIEGDTGKSDNLAYRRARSLAYYLIEHYSFSDSLITIVPAYPLYVETEALLARCRDTEPGIDVNSIKKLVRTVDGNDLRQAFKSIDKNNDDANWTWFKANILDKSRYAEAILRYKEKGIETQATVPALELLEPDKGTIEEENDAVAPRKSEVRIGTNLIYDAVTVANLYLEVGFAKHWAFNVLATFSPWDIHRPTVKFRTLVIQPELRYYFAKNFKGHYLGIEGHYGWYNIAVGGKVRYQDKDGNTPLWGAGLSYGYVLPFSKHWGMEFAVSAGYARLEYDCFYNVENGAKFDTRTMDWWGPTKAGISIYYQF